MRRDVLIVLGILLLSSFGVMDFVEEADALEDGVSFMTMYAKDDLYLTPKHVEEKTMEFNRTDRWSQLPMLPWQWYIIGRWDSESVNTDYTGSEPIKIEGVSTVWITISCPEPVTLDLRGSFLVNSNSAGESLVLEDVDIGPEPVTFTSEIDTTGFTLDNFNYFSMMWSMRGGSDDILIHLGEEFAGVSTYIEPLFVQNVYDVGDLGLHVEMINAFVEEKWTIDSENRTGWEFDFRASHDGGPFQEVEHYYSMSGGTDYHYISIPGVDNTPGDHYFEWEADYGVNSHSSGIYHFTIEEEEPPPDDDDPPNPPDDDDDPPIPPDDDGVELWTFEECERDYQDELNDELTFWSSFDSLLSYDSGVEIDQEPQVDIKDIEVYRQDEDLVIRLNMGAIPELGITDTGVYNVFVYFIDPSSGHQQPPMDIGEGADITDEDYEPSSALISNSLFHSSSRLWLPHEEVSGSSYIISDSIEDLISLGVHPDFEIFAKVQFNDYEDLAGEDSLDFRTTQDYAGYGAWEVDSSLIEERTQTGEDESIDSFPVYVIAAVIGISALVIVLSIAVTSMRKSRRKM